MAKCSNCGRQYPDGTSYCPECGTPLENDYTQQGRSYFQDAVGHKSYTNPEESPYTPEDIQQNRIWARLSYLGILVVFPLFLRKQSPYTRFHANQGLVLFIIECIYAFILRILTWLGNSHLLLSGFLLAASSLDILQIIFFCFSVMGIIQICCSQAKPLPLIGRIHILRQ